MTREEAIKALKWFKEYNEEDYCGGDRIQDELGDWYYRITEQDFEAFDMAIKALEQEPTTKNDLGVELIDRVELLKAMDTWDKVALGYDGFERWTEDCEKVPYVHYDDMVNCVKGMPSVTPQEPKVGHWIECMPGGAEEWCYKCSECNFWKYKKTINLSKFKYCPNCGAKMEEVEK